MLRCGAHGTIPVGASRVQVKPGLVPRRSQAHPVDTMSLANLPASRGPVELKLSGDFGQAVSPLRVFSVIRRRKWLFLAVAVALLAAALAAISAMRPYYDSDAVVMVATGKTEFSDLQASVNGTVGDSLLLRTQADIIRSPSMAARVVARLDLLHDPAFLRELHAPPSRLGLARQWLGGLLDPASGSAALGADTVERQQAAALLGRMTTVSNDGHSYLIVIRARTGDPRLSAAIADAYTQVYFAFNRDLKTAAIARGGALLDAQIAPLKTKVQDTENAVEAYRDRHNLVMNRTGSQPGAGSTIADQQLSQVSAELVSAGAALAQKEASLRAAESVPSSGGRAGAVPEVVASPLVQRLREQETALSEREASLAQIALDSNPTLQSVRAGLADTRRRIAAETAKIVSGLSGEVAAARGRRDALQQSLAGLQSEVSAQGQATVSLRQLESEADAARTVYKDYLGRYEQTSNQAALQEPEADLVSSAEASATRSGPPRLQYALIAALGSLLLAALAVLGAERARGGVRTAEDLEAQTGLFPLGFVPDATRGERSGKAVAGSAHSAAVGLVHSLLQGEAEGAAGVVAVTSALPREGRTVFAISLAHSAARLGRRTLLVDCSADRPAIAPAMGLAGRGEESADAVSWHRDARPGLDVATLRHGGAQGGAQQGSAADTVRGLLRSWREQYGLVILDTPPVLASADALALTALADGGILVVRWAATPVRAVNAAIRLLGAGNARVLGGVLTQVHVRDLAAGESPYATLYRRRAGLFQ